MAVAKREARERREAEERKRDEERREREKPQRLQHIAKRRKEALDQIQDELADVERLRRLIAGLANFEGGPSTPRVSQFLAWSQSELLSRAAAFSREGLESRFAGDRIFGDDDDHSFQSYHWY